MPISSNAPFNEFGQSMVLRDIEQIWLALSGAGAGAAGDGQTQDQSVGVDQETGDSGGVPDLSGLATIDYVNQVAQNVLDSIPPSTLGGDLSGVTASATVIGIRGVAVSSTAPSADEQAMLYNLPLSKWEPVTLIAANGGLLSKDGTGLVEVAGGTALSVVGNATNTAGSINAIAAASANTLLGRRGTTLTWDKVAKAEMIDAIGVSVIGRSANSTGVTADIAAGADGRMFQRKAGTLQFTADAVLGDGALTASSTAGSFGVVTSADGDYVKTSSAGIEVFDRSVSAVTPLITIAIGHASLTTTARALAVTAVDVCDTATGTVKSMLVIGSPAF